LPKNPGDRHADGLDDANWAILREAVIAAHRGDAHAAAAAVRRFDTDVPVDGQAGTYLWWLLRHRVAQMLGRRPARGDITQIAGYLEERFGGVIPDVTLLQNFLLTAWNLGPRERELSSGQFLVAGVMAQGILKDRSGVPGRPRSWQARAARCASVDAEDRTNDL
jgi:hypothetical protein